MAVDASQLKIRLAATMATSFSSTNVGGSKTTTNITGSTLGEVLFAMAAKASGGGSRTQHAKFFGCNISGTDTASGVCFWGENFADQMLSPAVPYAIPESADDDATKTLRWMGYENPTGNSLLGNTALNGTNQVNAPDPYLALHRITLHDTSSGALVAAAGRIPIYGAGGVLLGEIPQGLNCCTFEADFGLEASVDGSTTIATPDVAPAGVVLARPNAESEATAFFGGTLAPGAAVPIWQRWVLAERAKPSPDITYSLIMQILAA